MLIYSPGIVLLVWALVIVAGLNLQSDTLVPFLVAEGIAVAGYITCIRRRLR